MWRALVAFVGLLLAAGLYVLFTAGAADPAPAAAPQATSGTSFGFALAAGAIALMATIMVSKPRLRFRR